MSDSGATSTPHRHQPKKGLVLASLILIPLFDAGCTSTTTYAGPVSPLMLNGVPWDSEGLYPFRDGLSENSVGFIDASGKVIIQPIPSGKPDDHPLFSEGLAPFCDADKKFGYIDKQGHFAIPPQFFKAAPFRDGFARVEITKYNVAFIDHEGKVLPAPKLLLGFPSSEGLAQVKLASNGKWGYIDKTGKLVIDAQFEFAVQFTEGLAVVDRGDGKPAYIDKTGKVRLELKDAGFGSEFHEGRAQAGYYQRTASLIDTTGKVLAKLNPAPHELIFHEGLAAVWDNGYWGFIDRSGKIVIPIRLLDAEPFSNGLAPAKDSLKESSWGYIDTSGKFVIKQQFAEATPFFPAGIALVSQGGEDRYIDRNGKYIFNAPRPEQTP